ncbi:MAG: DNA replication protein [Alphaproteobacteria bacterium]|nr:DNA replication protein [Alphaproteobacteria bacterium]
MAQLPLDLGHLPALGREDFLIAASNEIAVGWLERWPDWPQPALAIYGPPGAGKTHLAHVFAARVRATGATPILIEPAGLEVETVPALVGASRAVVVDGANLAAEQALLHLYNFVAERRGHLLIVAPESPSHWSILLPDLRSRLLAAPAVALSPPDDALLGAVLVKLFADRQVTVAVDVIAYLVPRIERSFAVARATAAALDAAALAEKRPITVPLARRVLRL